ncbi:MAG: hypothetical protein ACP5G1_02220 [Nanopusillaceae archaeon]
MPWYPLFPTFDKEESEKVVRAFKSLHYDASYKATTTIDKDRIDIKLYKIENFLDDLAYYASKGKYKKIEEILKWNVEVGEKCIYTYFVAIRVREIPHPLAFVYPNYEEYLKTHKEYVLHPIINILMNDIIEMAQIGKIKLEQNIETGCLYFSFPELSYLIRNLRSLDEIEIFLGLKPVKEVVIEYPMEELLAEEIKKVREEIETLRREIMKSAYDIRYFSFKVEEIESRMEELEKAATRKEEIEELKKELEKIKKMLKF